MFEGVSIFALVVVAFVLLTTLMGVRKVPQGYNYTVERFGRYHKTLTPGLGLILPYIDAIGRKLNVMEQVLDVPKQEIITRRRSRWTASPSIRCSTLVAPPTRLPICNRPYSIW